MNKKVAMFITITAILETFILLFLGGIIMFNSSYDPKIFGSKESYDEKYRIQFTETKKSSLRGPAEVHVYIYDKINKYYLAHFYADIYNNGNKLTEDNYKIEYTDEYIRIYLINHDNSKQVYTFDIKDYESNQN